MASMRRVLIIVASIIFLAGIAFGIYIFFFAKGSATLIGSDGVPFGSADDVTGGGGEEVSDTPVKAGEEVAPRLIRITDSPVALGMSAVALPSRVVPSDVASGTPTTLPGDTEIRYIDRSSGNVYSYLMHERTLARISNRTLPGVQEAKWLSDGSMAYARFLSSGTANEQIETYALHADGSEGFFLERDLSEVAISGTSTLFTMLPSSNGSIGSVAHTDATSPRTLFTTPLSSLVVHLSDGPYMAATRASSGLDGYALVLDAAGSWSRMFGPLRGLSILPSPDGRKVLYSYLDGRTLRLSVFDRATSDSVSLPIVTFSEKCSWTSDSTALYCGVPKSLSGNLPDDWYQGALITVDRLWRVDLSDRVATLIIDPSETGGALIDVTAPIVDANADVFVFRNKTDGSLWAYDL